MTTGDRIKAARKKAGLTQAELAQKLGVTYQSLAQYERGRRNPKLETIRKIAAALGVSDRELMGDYEYDKPDAPQMKDILAAENWNRWVDENRKPIFSSREEFEKWSRDIDPSDPPLMTEYFLMDPPEEGIKKEPAPEESRLTDDVMELVDNYDALNQEGKDILLNTSRGLVASGLYQEEPTTSAG